MNTPVLEAIPACPWCGSTVRKPAVSFTNKPNRYVIAAAEKAGAPVESLLEKMSVFECQECGTSYCDPWLSREMRQWLFTLGRSQHFAGWYKFYEGLERSDEFERALLPRSRAIWRHILSRLGPVQTYAEAACPFMGLLGYFQTVRKPEPGAAFARFRQTCTQQDACGLHPQFMKRVPSLRSAGLGLKARRLASRWKKNPPPSAANLAADTATIPKSLTFLWAHTSLAWQDNCQSLGVSCAGMAAAQYGVALADIWKTQQRFDVIGFFNTLDHQDEPLRILEKAIAQARALVVELHDDGEAGKQHLFVMNDSLRRTAQARGWFLEEFSDAAPAADADAHDRLYLISLDGSFTLPPRSV